MKRGGTQSRCRRCSLGVLLRSWSSKVRNCDLDGDGYDAADAGSLTVTG